MNTLTTYLVLLPILILHVHCNSVETSKPVNAETTDTVSVDTIIFEGEAGIIGQDPMLFEDSIYTGNTTPSELIAFAKTCTGIPYKYAGTDPAEGFDCSGFITYIFNHFDIAVPRSSIDFTNKGIPVDLQNAKPGDLILFTGTDSSIREVGHMGLVVSNKNGLLEFIHSSSGKANGVVITPLEKYYMGRFEKVIRIFPEDKI